MFFSLTFLLLLFTPTNSRPNNYVTNQTIIRANESNETLPLLLTDDSSNVAIQRDNDVELIGRGTVDLILMDRTLDVDINLNKCFDRVKFCYSSLDVNGKATLLCDNGFCGFEIDGTSRETIDLTGQRGLIRQFLDKKCEPIRMNEIITNYCGLRAASCKPLIGEEDKRITVIVEKVSSSCQTLIKNARIYYPPTTTTTSTSLPSTNAPSETSNASNEWYIWVIIGVVFGFIIGIIIAM
uniref:Uncharacterized protein n=1 Tax=Panagrolaimus sp. PS1159 TaxID=55785 RepID=A0AC35F8E3_9BILA